MSRHQDSGLGIQGKKKIKTAGKANPSAESRILNPDPPETGGPKGLEPTRYGDWEIGGRCVDF